jgi:hypothetical protein
MINCRMQKIYFIKTHLLCVWVCRKDISSIITIIMMIFLHLDWWDGNEINDCECSKISYLMLNGFYLIYCKIPHALYSLSHSLTSSFSSYYYLLSSNAFNFNFNLNFFSFALFASWCYYVNLHFSSFLRYSTVS